MNFCAYTTYVFYWENPAKLAAAAYWRFCSRLAYLAFLEKSKRPILFGKSICLTLRCFVRRTEPRWSARR